MKKKDNILLEMLASIVLWGVLMQIILVLFFEDYLYNAVGLWCGVIIGAGMAIHMKRTIEDVLDLGGPFVEKTYRSIVVKRMMVVAVVIGVVFYFELGNPLSLLAGTFSLKISAYAQPAMHKVFQKFQKSK